MGNFDKDAIRDMEYDTSRGSYVGKDGSEFKSTPYSNGSGYKYDYYNKSPYGNTKHNSSHIKSDLNENWSRTDNDRDKGTQSSSSGKGCYLTSACMRHYQENFDDNCYELTVLRWFRDNYVSKEDVAHYYEIAPIIVEAIDKDKKSSLVYDYIYDNVVDACVEAIENYNFDFAYERYKNSIINLEKIYLGKTPELGSSLTLVPKHDNL